MNSHMVTLLKEMNSSVMWEPMCTLGFLHASAPQEVNH